MASNEYSRQTHTRKTLLALRRLLGDVMVFFAIETQAGDQVLSEPCDVPDTHVQFLEFSDFKKTTVS